MQRSPFAPASSEDELADDAVRRGRNVGGFWIIASVAAFGVGLVAGTVGQFVVAWSCGAALFTLGLARRARYWRSARRRLGDATMQRAQWRSAEIEREGPERIVAAIALVLLLLGYQLWRR